MMKKTAATICLSVILMLGIGCSSTLQLRSLDQLETNVKKHQVDHKALMDKVARPQADKDDWDKHYKATFDLINALKKQAE